MRHHRRVAILLISLILLLSGCTAALPVVTPAPILLATAEPTTGAMPPALSTPATAPATAQAAAPLAMPVATATLAARAISAPEHPTITETLAAGWTYVASGFKVDLPATDSFVPAQPPALSSVEIEQALASGDWLAAISPIAMDENGQGFRTVIISNDSGKETMRWWGQVDEYGTASTIVFTGMPRPKSAKINGATGKIITLPPGSAYERYFENQDGKRFGIASNKDVIRILLENMTEADGQIQVWGELRFAVNDYNGRRILVRNYDLKDVEPETILARAQAANTAQITPSPESDAIDLGPIAIVYHPKPRAIIHGQVHVSGEVDNPASDQVIVRAENTDGQILGEATVTTESPQDDRAQFTADVAFTDPPGLSDGRIAIYAPDPAAGQPLLLGWQEVRFAGDVGDMRVTIAQPESGTAIRGQIQVAGTATNIPSGSLLVRVEDATGVVMGKAKAKLKPNGNWRAAIQFRRPKTARPGVIAVYNVAPNGGVLVLLATQPVKLKR